MLSSVEKAPPNGAAVVLQNFEKHSKNRLYQSEEPSDKSFDRNDLIGLLIMRGP